VFARGSSNPYIKTDPYAPQNRRISILVKITAKNGGPKKLDVKTADVADPASALKDTPPAEVPAEQ
jgi:hypothetical protein